MHPLAKPRAPAPGQTPSINTLFQPCHFESGLLCYSYIYIKYDIGMTAKSMFTFSFSFEGSFVREGGCPSPSRRVADAEAVNDYDYEHVYLSMSQPTQMQIIRSPPPAHG